MKTFGKAAIGLRAKTARAIVVVLGGDPRAPLVVMKGEIRLADPKVPATAQPYHEVMDLPWDESQRAAKKFVSQIEAVARKAMSKLVTEQSREVDIAAVGIVGARDRDLNRIGNPHIRAHAAEGVLFRRVLDLAADELKLKRRNFPDKDFDQSILLEVGGEHARLQLQIKELGRTVAPPWRTEEKQAAIAAWLALHH